jgi:RP/EB family microtubule-associated protein
MGESRTELIAWVNELLSLNYTKVEQCGTGGAYCQIMDSVFGELDISTGLRRL